MSTQQLAPVLTPEQLKHYHEEGYLLHQQPLLPPDRFLSLKDYFEELLRNWPTDQRPEAMDVPHFTHPKLIEWALEPNILDLVEQIIGPDIILFSTHFICKPKGDGRRVPWHEDSAYWKPMITPMEVVTVWLALDPSTPQNGCMYVVPRTHNTGKKGFSDYDPVNPLHNVFSTEITPSQRKDELAVPCELQPNQCSLHDARIIHGSPPNTSNIRRCGWTLRFIPATVQVNPAMIDKHVVYMARGRNLLNQPMADPTRAYPEIIQTRLREGIKSH